MCPVGGTKGQLVTWCGVGRQADSEGWRRRGMGHDELGIASGIIWEQ